MSEKRTEKSMSSVTDFASTNIKYRIAPAGSAENIKARIRLASRKLGWSFSRTRDVWYADPRVSIKPHELRQIELKSGVEYGRAELRTVEDLISKADQLLDSQDADFYGEFRTALRTFFRQVASS